MMKKNVDLLEGPIFPSLMKLALPIMGTSMIQMAYNMTDMIWIGRLGSAAVASVGSAGMFTWLASGLSTLARMGGQVKVAQSLGAGRREDAVSYARGALQLGTLFGLLFALVAALFSGSLIRFLRLNDPKVIHDGQVYLSITCGLIIFNFLNQIMTGLMTAMGNSKAPFIATTIGLATNIFLDPVLIFGFGPVPRLEVSGAAIATVLAQVIVFSILVGYSTRDSQVMGRVRIWQKTRSSFLRTIVKVGLPVSLQSMVFASISMLISRLVAGWGDGAVAVQKVGSQIESISWMTADGFASAINAFVGQNYGAKNLRRVRRGFDIAAAVMAVWGTLCGLALMVFPQHIFRIFIPEASVLAMGVDYLRILGLSQMFMCIEITTAGAFQGLGMTVPPSVEGIVLTGARIPMAMALSATALGLGGIWWSVTISSILKGVVLFVWFWIAFRKLMKQDASVPTKKGDCQD